MGVWQIVPAKYEIFMFSCFVNREQGKERERAMSKKRITEWEKEDKDVVKKVVGRDMRFRFSLGLRKSPEK